MTKDFSIKRKNYFRQLFSIILLCFSFVVLMTNTTLAWFRDESITSNESEISLIGTVSVDVFSNFNFYNLALAPDKTYTTDYLGERIGTYLKTSSDHDTDGAYVRIKYETSRKNPGDSSSRDNYDLLTLYFEDNLTTKTTYSDDSIKGDWFYNTSDGFYYYIGAVDENEICFNKGYITSNYMTNDEADAEVYIKFTVDAIQRQYDAYKEVWTTAPNVFKEWAEKDKEDKWGKLTQQ